MSSSWKSQGRSFNSLVKRNTSGVDIRANDRAEHRSDRDAIQVYYCPDASGSGKEATIASAELEFGKCAFGVEASNNLIFNDAYFGIDASANIQFTDVSGGLGRAGLFFRTSTRQSSDEQQNILLTDASGESLLIRLRPFWNPYGEPAATAPGTASISGIDPSWNYGPGTKFGGGATAVIGCPIPKTPTEEEAMVLAGNFPEKGGTLGAVTIDIGGLNGLSNSSVDPADHLRAQQFAKAVGNPFDPNGKIGAVDAKEGTGYFWSDYDVWKDYPKLGVASSIFGKSDSSSCIVWQIEPKNEMTGDPHDISYNSPGGVATTNNTPVVNWTAAANPNDPNHVDHPHYGLTDQSLDHSPAGPEGSFTHGREIVDI